MSTGAKVPRTPPAPLRRRASDVVSRQVVLWRIHRTVGAHTMPWNGLRTFGPLPSMRFDPHPAPLGDHPGYGVSYAATDLTTALAEAFALARVIDTRTGSPAATAWTPVRPLRLLDLGGRWALRNGAAAALHAAPRSTCRAWSRAIRETWPDLDGLWTPSTLTGDRNVVLWSPGLDSFPANPLFSRPLAHPVLWLLAREAADRIGYRVV